MCTSAWGYPKGSFGEVSFLALGWDNSLHSLKVWMHVALEICAKERLNCLTMAISRYSMWHHCFNSARKDTYILSSTIWNLPRLYPSIAASTIVIIAYIHEHQGVQRKGNLHPAHATCSPPMHPARTELHSMYVLIILCLSSSTYEEVHISVPYSSHMMITIVDACTICKPLRWLHVQTLSSILLSTGWEEHAL
jgi:hypothetical protein